MQNVVLAAYPIILHRSLMFPARLLCRIHRCFRHTTLAYELDQHEVGRNQYSHTFSRTAR